MQNKTIYSILKKSHCLKGPYHIDNMVFESQSLYNLLQVLTQNKSFQFVDCNLYKILKNVCPHNIMKVS